MTEPEPGAAAQTLPEKFLNPECQNCKLRVKGENCSLIFWLWNGGRLKRPEFFQLVTRLAAEHAGEMCCNDVKIDLPEILKRQYHKRKEKPPAGSVPEKPREMPQQPVTRTIPAVLVGRMPRKTKGEPWKR